MYKRQDLNRLNSAKSGLGTKAIDYVLSGKNETVLSTLSNGTFFELLELQRGAYVSHKSSRNRRGLLARMKPYDSKLAVRYAQVLCAVSEKNSKNSPGSKQTPSEIRSLFGEIFFGVDSQRNNYIGSKENFKSTVSPQIAFDLVKELGGGKADYFDVVYNIGTCLLYTSPSPRD